MRGKQDIKDDGGQFIFDAPFNWKFEKDMGLSGNVWMADSGG